MTAKSWKKIKKYVGYKKMTTNFLYIPNNQQKKFVKKDYKRNIEWRLYAEKNEVKGIRGDFSFLQYNARKKIMFLL